MDPAQQFAGHTQELAKILYQLRAGDLTQAVARLDQLVLLARHYHALDTGTTEPGDSCAHLCDSALRT